MAFTGAFFIARIKKEKIFGFWFNLVYGIILCIPTVILNSALWGQSDAIYVSFTIIALILLCREHYTWSFIFWGLGFTFKLQSIFVLPFFVLMYLYKKNFSLRLFFIPAIVLWLSGLPAYLVGRNLFAPFQIYFFQGGAFHRMYLNFPSFWAVIGENYELLKSPAVFLTAALCGVGVYVVLSGYKKINSELQYLNTSIWFIWTVILFLPAMHERYSFMLDVLLVMLCFLDSKYLLFCAGENLLSTITYKNYLFGNNIIHLEILAVINILLYLGYTYLILREENISKS